MKLIFRIKIIGIAIIFMVPLFSMEESENQECTKEFVKESHEEPLNIAFFDFVYEPDLIEYLEKQKGDDCGDNEDEYVVVEKQPFPQIDLSLFDQECEKQKNDSCNSGTLFEYNPLLIKQVFKKFSNVKEHFLRSLFRYTPNSIDKNIKPLSYFVIHGTYGRETKGYYDFNDPLFKNIIAYAADKAEKQQTYIDVYSYEWSGMNDDDARIYAGMLLGYMINSIKNWYGQHDIFAFSHGVNVGLVASNQLEKFKINEFIAIAPPVLEDGAWFYAPHNITNFFSFFSVHDIVRWIGHKWANSYDNACTKYKDFCKKGLKERPFDKEGNIYKNRCDDSVMNIWYTEDNYSPGHCETPDSVAKYLIALMSVIYKNFIHKNIVKNISLNIVPEEKCENNSQFELCNISLFPQDKKEEELYSTDLPKETLVLSKKNEDDHFKIYGYKKNEESWWYNYYSLARKIYK